MENKNNREGLQYYYHKGHYNAEDIELSLESVKNIFFKESDDEDVQDSVDYQFENASVFLHGACHLFALALHEKYGYPVYQLYYRDSVYFHAFCKAVYHKQVAFIDVRGITTNEEEFVSTLEPGLSRDYLIGKRDIRNDKLLQEEGDAFGIKFARALIQENWVMYDISQ